MFRLIRLPAGVVERKKMKIIEIQEYRISVYSERDIDKNNNNIVYNIVVVIYRSSINLVFVLTFYSLLVT